MHHSSEHYNLSTALRQPVADAFGTFVPYGILAWLGIRPSLIEQARGINLIYQFWIHTEVIQSLGPLESVLNTPSHHRVHHGANRQYLDRNHGSILIIWDRLFGTFEREDEPVRYGLTKNIDTFNPAEGRDPRIRRHRCGRGRSPTTGSTASATSCGARAGPMNGGRPGRAVREAIDSGAELPGGGRIRPVTLLTVDTVASTVVLLDADTVAGWRRSPAVARPAPPRGSRPVARSTPESSSRSWRTRPSSGPCQMTSRTTFEDDIVNRRVVCAPAGTIDGSDGWVRADRRQGEGQRRPRGRRHRPGRGRCSGGATARATVPTSASTWKAPRRSRLDRLPQWRRRRRS